MSKFNQIHEGDEILIKYNREEYRVTVELKNTRYVHTSCPWSLRKFGRRQLCFGKKEFEGIVLKLYPPQPPYPTQPGLEAYREWRQQMDEWEKNRSK
jgi:hypothetical protein